MVCKKLRPKRASSSSATTLEKKTLLNCWFDTHNPLQKSNKTHLFHPTMPWPARPLHIPGNADGKALITMLKTEAVSGAAGDGQPQDNSY